MANYVKATNFTAKDSLITGNPAKIIKGAEIDDEFNAIATAIATKPDSNSPTLTGIPVAPTAIAGTNTTQIATTAFVQAATDVSRTYSNLQTFKDTTFEVVDDADATKKLNLQLSDITTATTRTLTIPNKSGTIALASDIAIASVLTTSSGVYAASGSSTVTVTITAHGRSVGDIVYLNFTSGTLVDGYFTIVTATTNSFTITYGSSQTASGNVTGYYSNLGTVALASPDEAIAGISTTRATTPAGVSAAITAKINSGTIGSGQTWSDQSGSKTNNVQYTNSTGKPIMVGLGYGRSAACQVYVDGVYIAGLYHDGNNNSAAYYSFIVPTGSTYQVNSTNWSLDSGAHKWSELR